MNYIENIVLIEDVEHIEKKYYVMIHGKIDPHNQNGPAITYEKDGKKYIEEYVLLLTR